MPSVSAEALLFNPDPATYLPHRYPFLQLDRIIALETGYQAVAIRAVSSSRGCSQMLLVESVAQLSGIVTITAEGEGGFLASIDRAEFFGSPRSGDLLTISTRVVKSFGRLFMIEGSVCCHDRTLLAVQLTLGVGRL